MYFYSFTYRFILSSFSVQNWRDCKFLEWKIFNSPPFFRSAEFSYLLRETEIQEIFECSPFAPSTDVADKITRNYRGFYSRIVYHTTFGFMALCVSGWSTFHLSVRDTCSISGADGRAKQPQTSICCEQMDGVSRKKRKNHNGMVGCSGIPFLLSVDS